MSKKSSFVTILVIVLISAAGIVYWSDIKLAFESLTTSETEIWVVNAGRSAHYVYENITDEAFLSRISNGEVIEQIPIRVGSFSLDIHGDTAYIASWDATSLSTEELQELDSVDSTAYKAYLINVIQVVDLDEKKVLREFSSMGELPSDVLVYGDKIFVTNYLSDSVAVFDLDTEEFITTIDVGNAPRSVRVSPNNLLFIPNTLDDSVSIIDPIELTEIKRIKTGTNPQTVAFTNEVALIPADALSSGQSYDERAEPLTTISLDDLEVIPPSEGDPEFVASDILVASTGEIFLTRNTAHVTKILEDGINLDSTENLTPDMETSRTLRLVEDGSSIYVTLYDAGKVVELNFNLSVRNRYEVGSGAYDIAVRVK